MQRSTHRRDFGALLLAAILGFPGLAAELFPSLPGWDLFAGIFLEDETPPPDDSGTGGGAMDPNGKPKPNPDPHPGSNP